MLDIYNFIHKEMKNVILILLIVVVWTQSTD